MQPTIEITPETIDQLRPQLSGRHCVVEAFGGRGAGQAYLLRVNHHSFRITRNTVRELLSRNALPSNIAIPIIDFALEQGIFKMKRIDPDDEPGMLTLM